jgi:hypothetical protein
VWRDRRAPKRAKLLREPCDLLLITPQEPRLCRRPDDAIDRGKENAVVDGGLCNQHVREEADHLVDVLAELLGARAPDGVRGDTVNETRGRSASRCE